MLTYARSRLAGGPAPTNYKARGIRKDGNEISLKLAVSLIVLSGRGVLQGTVEDITDRKQAEEALREKSKQVQQLADELQLIIDSIPGLIFYKDTENRFIRVNKYVADAHKMTKKQLEGTSCFELYPREIAQAYFKDDLQVIRSRQPKLNIDEPWETEFGTRWVNTSKIPYVNDKGKVTGLIGLAIDDTERKKAEEALKKSEERYRDLVENINDAIYELSADGSIIYMSPVIESIVGYKLSEIIGKNFVEFIHPEDVPRVKKMFQGIISGVVEQDEYRIVSKSGEILWVRTSSCAIENKGGAAGFHGVLTDITKHKRAEEERILLLDNMDALVWYLTQGAVNKALSDFLGAKKSDIEYKNLFELFSQEEAAVCIAGNRRVFEEKKTVNTEEWVVNAKGEPRLLAITKTPKLSEDGSVEYMVCSGIDITERKKMEKALRSSEEQSRTIVETAPSLLVIADTEGNNIYVSPNCEQITGYKAEELLGRVFWWVHDDDLARAKRVFNKTFSKMIGNRNFEYKAFKKDGELWWASTSWEPLHDEQGTFLGVVLQTLDITGRKRAEEELQRSQKQLRNLADHLQSKREDERMTIAREIHDEMGQALTVLKMDLSWLARKVPGDREELLEKIRVMSGLVSTTHKTVQRIITELRPGLLDDLGLTAAMEWQTGEFQSRTGITCQLTIDPEDIVIDENRSTALFRILQESLTNVSRHAGATRVTVNLKEKKGQITLRVRDNGKGITKEQLSGNTSFGIMGIRERVHQFQGKMRISGGPGKGTTVVVEMPKKD